MSSLLAQCDLKYVWCTDRYIDIYIYICGSWIWACSTCSFKAQRCGFESHLCLLHGVCMFSACCVAFLQMLSFLPKTCSETNWQLGGEYVWSYTYCVMDSHQKTWPALVAGRWMICVKLVGFIPHVFHRILSVYIRSPWCVLGPQKKRTFQMMKFTGVCWTILNGDWAFLNASADVSPGVQTMAVEIRSSAMLTCHQTQWREVLMFVPSQHLPF